MIQKDKLYYLKNLELALLLSLKGMKNLIGFKMDCIERSELAAVYRTLFDLEKKEFIEVGDKKQLRICPELDMVLTDIKQADRMLLCINREPEYPDRCIYLGNRAVFVSAYGAAGNMNRIESVPKNAVAEKVCENGFRLEEILSDESLYGKARIEKPELEEKAGLLFGKDFTVLEEGKWGNITGCLKLVSLKNRQYKKQYLLIRDGLDDYFAVTDEKTSIYPYSKRIIMEILNQDI